MKTMKRSMSAFVTSYASTRLASGQAPWVCSRQSMNGAARWVHARCTMPAVLRMGQDVSTSAATVTTDPTGEEGTISYRLLFKNETGVPVSPWHDLALRPGDDRQIINFVNEIPRGLQAKMEISTDEENNPIKQDVKKGALRFYKYGPSLVNYGAIPRTWEDPGSIDPDLNMAGDGDPLDVTEIGSKSMPFGSVYPVKVLGVLALLDEGEVDWKVIAINVDDPLANQLNTVEDLEKVMPGRVDDVREWFRLYKTAEGKGENEYGYGGEAKGLEFALNVVDVAHQSWADLRSGKISNDDGLYIK